MKDLNLKIIVQAIDRVTKPVRKMGEALGDISRRARLDRLASALNRVKEKLRAVSAMAKRAGKKLREIGGGALTRITAPIALLGGFALNAFGKMEQLQIAFESMLGSAASARTMVKSLADFAASTPFQLEGIGAAAKQLLSFGVAEDDVIGRLKILGDIAAGAGVPLQDMASIFGKAKAKGKAMTEELLQLSDRGVPIIDVLAKQMKVPKEAIFDLASKGKISFEILAKAMESMTQSGGIFADQMKKQSQSLFGLLSTLKDNVFNAFVEIGKIMVETFSLKGGMASLTEWLKEAIDSFKAFAQANPVLTKAIVILIGVAAAAGPVLIALGLMASGFGMVASGAAALMGGLSFVVTGLVAIGSAFGNFFVALRAGYSAMAAFNLVLAANPIGIVLIAVAAFAAAAYLLYRNWDKVAAFFSDLWAEIKAAFDKGLIRGVIKLLEMFNPVIWIAKGINALVQYLFGIDLAQIGFEWMSGFSEGITVAWQSLIGWLSDAVTSLTKLMPDWVKDKLGLGDIKGKITGPAAAAIPPALGPQNNQVGGAIKIEFSNAPANMHVQEIKSDTPGFNLDVDAGMAMAGP